MSLPDLTSPPGTPLNWTFLSLVVLFAIWRISLEFRINSRLKAIAARGEPTTAAELNRSYAAVPDPENAALVWLEGFEQIVPKFRRGYEPWSRLTFPNRARPGSDDWATAAQGFLNSNRLALATFRRAVSLEGCRFQIDLAGNLSTNYLHLERLRASAELMQMEAFVAAERGKTDVAIESILTMLAGAGAARSEPTVIAMLSSSSIDSMAFRATEYLLNCNALNDENLRTLSLAFARAEDSGTLCRALIGERATLVATLGSPKKIIAEPSRENSTFENSAAALFGEVLGIFDREVRFTIDAFECTLPLSRLPDPQRFATRDEWDRIEERGKAGFYLLSGILLPSLSRTVSRDCEHRARMRIVQTVLAIERFRLQNGGQRPPNVFLIPEVRADTITDPFDGGSLRLRPTPAGYVVYSIGSDAQDNGGAVSGTKKRAGDDITFFVER